jgi:hypothetical protein
LKTACIDLHEIEAFINEKPGLDITFDRGWEQYADVIMNH